MVMLGISRMQIFYLISTYQIVCEVTKVASHEIHVSHSYQNSYNDETTFTFIVYDSACYQCNTETKECKEQDVCYHNFFTIKQK